MKMEISEHKENMLREWMDKLRDDITRDYDAFDMSGVEEVKHESRDGFWAWADGGFRVMIMHNLSSAAGSGYTCPAIEPFLASAHDDAWDDWKREHNKPSELKYTDYDFKDDAEQETFWQTRDDWMREGSEFWYCVHAYFYSPSNSNNETGKPEVFIKSGVNTDFTYGREAGLNVNYLITLPIDLMTPSKLAKVAERIHATMGE